MAGTAHDVIVETLREDPSLVGALVETLTGRSLPSGLLPVDSTIRFVKVAEVRPDIVLAEQEREWAIVEVQNKIDEAKGRRWMLAAAVLLDQTRVLGDVVTITTRQHVAKWARTVACFESKAGTKLTLTPIVLHLGRREIEILLDEQRPELSLFAVWAMQHRHGAEAKAVLVRAVEITEQMPTRLQKAQMDAIFLVLSRRIHKWLQELSMDRNKMDPTARKLSDLFHARWDASFDEGKVEGQAEGQVKGERDALFALLAARRLEPTPEQRAAIMACVDPATLLAWIVKVSSAANVADVLASTKPPRAAARKTATRKTPPRRVA